MHIATVKSPGWDKTMKKLNKVKWKPNSYVSRYEFSNPKRMGPLTRDFMKFVKSCEKYGKKATKKAFYKIINKELLPGNNSRFFAAIKDAGIVTLNKEWNGSYTESWYTIGPNWFHYLDGNLERE